MSKRKGRRYQRFPSKKKIRSCGRKRPFSKREARENAIKSRGYFYSYKCLVCEYWHLSSIKKRKRWRW